MKIFKHIFLVALATFFTSCSEQQARKPISHSSGTFMKESIDRNKKMNTQEKEAIAKIIKKDTAHIYNISEKGFWYAYKSKSSENVFPVKGDVVNFDYEVTDLYGNSIYSAEFIFPSQSAYGYHGDDKKIGTNQPIICIVTLNDIKTVTPE